MNFFLKISRLIDFINTKIGQSAQIFTIALVCVQFTVVVLRYIFGYNSTFMQESVVWMYGIMVFLSASWAYILDRHVRVDVAYQGFSKKGKALANLFGCVFLLLPLLIVLWVYIFPYVIYSWSLWETSPEIDGIPAVFILKSFLLIFVGLLFMQMISECIKNLHIYLSNKG